MYGLLDIEILYIKYFIEQAVISALDNGQAS